MAVLTITELNGIPTVRPNSTIMAPSVPAVAEQAVAIGGTTAPSNAFNTATKYIMVACDTACCLAFGAAPTAVAGVHLLPANTTRFYGVQPGSKVAVIAAA